MGSQAPDLGFLKLKQKRNGTSMKFTGPVNDINSTILMLGSFRGRNSFTGGLFVWRDLGSDIRFEGRGFEHIGTTSIPEMV